MFHFLIEKENKKWIEEKLVKKKIEKVSMTELHF